MFTNPIYLIYMNKPDLALYNLPWLICHQTKPKKTKKKRMKKLDIREVHSLHVHIQNFCAVISWVFFFFALSPMEYEWLLNRSIWPIDRTPKGTTTLGHSGFGCNGNDGVVYTPKSSRSSLVSYPVHLFLEVSYSYIEDRVRVNSRRWNYTYKTKC